MLESVYTSEVFSGIGPHLSLRCFCIFKVIFYLQLLLLSLVWSSPSGLSSGHPQRERQDIAVEGGMRNLNKQGLLASQLT